MKTHERKPPTYAGLVDGVKSEPRHWSLRLWARTLVLVPTVAHLWPSDLPTDFDTKTTVDLGSRLLILGLVVVAIRCGGRHDEPVPTTDKTRRPTAKTNHRKRVAPPAKGASRRHSKT